MVFALTWPGALVIGLSLGLLGSGGSILTVPVLVYLAGQEEKLAIAGSLAIVGMIAAAAALPYVRDKLVDWRTAVMFGVPGMAGTYLGAWSSAFVSGEVQMGVFALVMLLASYFMLRPPQFEAPTGGVARNPVKVTADGLIVGIITGFVGVGGGFLVVPALVLLGGLSMQRAVGTSLVIIAAKSLTGFYKYLDVLEAETLSLDWPLILTITAVGIIGSFFGSHWGCRISQDKLQRGFGCFLVGMGTYIFLQQVV